MKLSRHERTRLLVLLSLLAAGAIALSRATTAQVSTDGAEPGTGTGAMAVEPDPVMDTGAILRAALDETTLLFADRRVTARTELLGDADKVERYLAQRDEDRAKRVMSRISCRDDIRRANRDESLRTILRCYRAELLLEIADLRRERAFIAAVSGVRDIVAAETDLKIGSLVDGLMSLVDGIDAGVYQDPSTLVSAKQRLHANFRLPERAAMLRLRADRQLSWISLLAGRLVGIAKESPGSLETHPAAWLNAMGALRNQAGLLTRIGAENDYQKMKEIYGQYQSALPKAADSLRTLSRLSGQSSSSSSKGKK